jgi:hypothetical protein
VCCSHLCTLHVCAADAFGELDGAAARACGAPQSTQRPRGSAARWCAATAPSPRATRSCSRLAACRCAAFLVLVHPIRIHRHATRSSVLRSCGPLHAPPDHPVCASAQAGRQACHPLPGAALHLVHTRSRRSAGVSKSSGVSVKSTSGGAEDVDTFPPHRFPATRYRRGALLLRSRRVAERRSVIDIPGRVDLSVDGTMYSFTSASPSGVRNLVCAYSST